MLLSNALSYLVVLLWVSEYPRLTIQYLLSEQEIKVCLSAYSLPLHFDLVQICILWLKRITEYLCRIKGQQVSIVFSFLTHLIGLI